MRSEVTRPTRRALLKAAPAGLALASLGGLAAAATGRWLRAESPRFIVYSEGKEAELRDYTRKLEVFDSVLRSIHGLPIDGVPPTKLSIFLVDDWRDMRRIYPTASADTQGFYAASDSDILAVANRTMEDQVLLHEYTHHFMLQYFAYPYPAWLREGYAEFFMTAEVKPDVVNIGKWSEYRANALVSPDWLPMERLLRTYPQALQRPGERDHFYAQSWALVHWFMTEPGRYPQLLAYMKAVGEGADPVEAMKTATGLMPNSLETKLKAYVNGKLMYRPYAIKNLGKAEISVTSLPPEADELLLEDASLKAEIMEAAPALASARKRATKYRGTRLGELVLARAEANFGDRVVARSILQAWLSNHPDDVEALELCALERLKDGEADPTNQRARYKEAQPFLGKASKLNPDRWQTLWAYARSRSLDPDYPTQNTLNVLLLAHELAPQVGPLSFDTADALSRWGKDAEAESLFALLANNPHGGSVAEKAREQVNRLRAKRGASAAAG